MIGMSYPARMEPLANAIRMELVKSGFAVQPVDLAATQRNTSNLDAVEVLISMLVPCGGREIIRLPKLRGIVSPLLGYDWIDVAAATRHSIPVVNGRTRENSESMAEATIMLLLALLYQLNKTEESVRNGRPATDVYRHMLKERAIGVIGLGSIARHLIARLERWGCHINVFSRSAEKLGVPEVGFKLVSMEELLATSDAIIILTNLEAGTAPLLGEEQISVMKNGAMVINTSRGGLLDENALAKALTSGRLGGAALDVFEEEPLPKDSPLRSCPNLILTPHAIGHTQEATFALIRKAGSNVRDLLSGKIPDDCVNPEFKMK